MKTHLPILLRRALLLSFLFPAHAALTWNSGQWNSTETSWLQEGTPAVFQNGDAVEFTASAADFNVQITETVEPASALVTGGDYTFSGAGSISGITVVSVQSGASLVLQNANSYTGGSVVESGAVLELNQYNSAGSANTSESALGEVSGGGMLKLNLATVDTTAAIVGSSLQNFSGTLYIMQGSVGLGRTPTHSGAGQSAQLGAEQVWVSSGSSFITSLGGGRAALTTGNLFSSDLRLASGGTAGNRDGHINWSGNVYLNMQDVTAATPAYDSTGQSEFSFYYSKYVVWDGVVSGAGTLELTTGTSDSNQDHRLVLTNDANTFSGTYLVNATYLGSLALASESAAASASVQLDTATSRLVLMGTDASIASLNGAAGVVLPDGGGNYTLSTDGGVYAGSIQDGTQGKLGITMKGSGVLSLVGSNCSYTGATTVQSGSIQYSGPAALGDISVLASGASLSVEGNLTLNTSASLNLYISGTADAVLQSGGELILSDQVHLLTISGYEALAVGSYPVLSWGAASSVTNGQFSVSGLSDTSTLHYSTQVSGNALNLVVSNLTDAPWLWRGDSATWSDTSSAEWSNTSGGQPAGQSVMFSVLNDGTVSIQSVTPASILVSGGSYVFAAADSSAVGIVSSGKFTVSGESTELLLQLANPSFTGETELLGGVLEIGVENALGSSSVVFNGGTLRYGTGITQDISAQVSTASLAAVAVDTNGNNVAWSQQQGVQVALTNGAVKSGAGEWSLTWTGAGETYAGDFNVQEGGLNITKPSGNGTLSGRFSGSGTIELSSATGQLSVLGNNSDFAGTLLLSGDGSANAGSIRFADGNALGGADTLVQLAGQRFWFAVNTTTNANLEIMEGTTTYFDGSSGNSYTFTGTVSGSGSVIVKPSCNITMSGDISAFTGQFEHPGSTAVVWLFGGDGVDGNGLVQAGLHSAGANMVYEFNYAQPTTMSGVVSGTAQLTQSGAGLLTLTGDNTSSGALNVAASSELQLGSSQDSASWSGTSLSGGGLMTLVNGTLVNGLSSISGTLVADVSAGGTVDMGGMDANVLESINVEAGGLLTGIQGNLNIGSAGGVGSMSLALSQENIGSSAVVASGEKVMVEIEGGSLVVYDAASVSLDMEAVKDILQGQRQAVYLHLSNAPLSLENNISAQDLFANSATTPAALGLVVLGIDGGNIVLEGAVRDVYMVTQNGDYPTVTDYTRLQPYKATFVDSGYTLALQLPGDNTQLAWVNNLLGYGDFTVENTSQSTGLVRVLLNNEVFGPVDGTLPPTLENEVETANTEILGSITAGAAVQLVKTGSGTLTVGGNLVADWLELDEGSLRLGADGNVVNTLHGDGQLILLSGSKLEVAADSASFAGSLSGSGELLLSGTLPASGSVGALSGSGTLLADGSSFVVQNVSSSTFSGTLSSSGADGVLTVENGGGVFTMQRVQMSPQWSIQNAGKTVFSQAASGGNAMLTLASLSLLDDSQTSLVLNTDAGMEVFSLGSLLVEDGAQLTLQSVGNLAVELDSEGNAIMGKAEQVDLGADGIVPLTLEGRSAFAGIEQAWLTLENGWLIFHAIRDEENKYEQIADSENARTGAQMLWHLPNQLLAASPALSLLTQTLDSLLAAGRRAEANELMAAAAGAGTAVLSPVLLGDVERQLKTIRNRTTSMGLDSAVEYDDLPLYNAWIQAEGDYRELDASGTLAGYRVSSWGGTVGVDADFSPALTAGLAFTAMYGDITARSADSARGDSDTYYLSLFGRYAVNRWTHTLVGTIGFAEMKLHRYIQHERGHYESHGRTHGLGFGFLYEAGYVIPLDEDRQTCIQPIANVSFRYAGVDGYTEHGSDASLHSGNQDMELATFGLGARFQTYALENLYNRTCLLEARALLKVDAGDRRSHHNVSLLAAAERGGRIISAKQGLLGMEAGAGIAVPLGADSGHLFLDASVEIRDSESEVNGSVGYRMNF